MKNKNATIIIAIAIMTALNVQSQSIGVPGFSITSGQAPVEWVTTITNTGSRPAQIMGIADDPAHPLKYLNDSLFAESIADTIHTSDQQKMIKVCRAVARIEKSPWFIAEQWLPDDASADNPDSMRARLGSVIGSLLGMYTKKCDDFAAQGINYALATGLVSRDSFRMVSLPEHTLCEAYQDGFPMAVDWDAWMPGFMAPNAARPNGYAAIADIIGDPSIIQKYFWCDSLDISMKKMNDYRSWFISPAIAIQPTRVVPRRVTGDIIICPQCTLRWNYQTPQWIDTSTSSGQRALAVMGPWIVRYRKTLDESYRDSINHYGADSMGLVGDIMALLATEQIVLCGGSGAWQPKYRGTIPSVTFEIPASADTLWIGRDVKFPGLIMQVTASHPIAAGDTMVQQASFPIWNDTLRSGTPYRAINYFDQGFIPPNTTATIMVSTNPRLLYDVHHGFTWRNIADADFLTVEQWQSLGSTDGFRQPPCKDDETIDIFPNPAHQTIIIRAGSACECRLIDGQGRLMHAWTLDDSGYGQLSLGMLAPGCYFLKINNSIRKLLRY